MNKHLFRAGEKPAMPSSIYSIPCEMRFLISLSAGKTHGHTTKAMPVDAFQQGEQDAVVPLTGKKRP